MNLDTLIALGGVVPHSITKKSITWKHRDVSTGEPVEHTFEVFIKRQMSAADAEFIHSSRGEDDAFSARRVHRLVRILDPNDAENPNGASIPDDFSQNMDLGLLTTICRAINEVEKENSPKVADGETTKN